jgi:hypothetical protein
LGAQIEAKSPQHFLFACHAYQELRQRLWAINEVLWHDVAAKVQLLMAKPEEEIA